jgi:tRNA A-37 threonylcarbamoyl transferase component Bud32
VRQNKEKLDKLKEDTASKVDVLKSSRTSLLLDVMEKYVKAIEEFYEHSTKAYEEALNSLSDDIDTYEIDILKV